jgi:glycosyltransferase involved in cell wall biosynthesis
MIDIIIATYNRPKEINSLVSDIQGRSIPAVNHIIVVDSTAEENSTLKNRKGVMYIHSSHKNQPYQRYLGYRLAESDNLLFLDDDMQILDEKVFNQIEEVFADRAICGINLAFENRNQFLSRQQTHQYTKGGNGLKQRIVGVVQTMTARPTIKDGKMWYCGLRGKRVDGQYSEFFSGGAFAAKKEFLYRNFNFNLLSLYDKKTGKGEDAVLAYTLSKHGKIFNLPGELFFHNDPGNSVYTASNKAYQYRVAYSRLFLSNEYARLNNRQLLGAFLITFWYNLWRSIGLFFLCIKKGNFTGFAGYAKGSLSSIGLFFQKDATEYWFSEINSDLNEKGSN